MFEKIKKMFCEHEWVETMAILDCQLGERNGFALYGTQHKCECKKCGAEKFFCDERRVRPVKR